MAGVELIGESAKFRAVLDEITMVAPTDSVILIQGETGTGKEIIAEAIHQASRRRDNPFVAINCAAIPSALLESELFGHERGAFTGAVTQAVGRFQAADRGTLFLDEIGDLPLELQPKLLRVLQEKRVERLGSARSYPIDVRIIAATNQNLWQMVQERKFRADLYYRLDVFPVFLPPLRERGGDVQLLANHFVRSFAKRQGKLIQTFSDEAMQLLESHSWPGNIRELQNVIERAVILSNGPVVESKAINNFRESVREPVREPVESTPPLQTLVDAERAHIRKALEKTNWVIGGERGAAVRLGMARTTLIYKMRRLGIYRKYPPTQEWVHASPEQADIKDYDSSYPDFGAA